MRSLACWLAAAFVAGGRPAHPAGVDTRIVLPLREEALREGYTARRVGQMWSLTGDTLELLVVPPMVLRGDTAAIELLTTGGGCVAEDTTVATVTGLVATVVPYQRVFLPVPPNGSCTETLRLGPPSVIRLVFATAGRARVDVVYREPRGALQVFHRKIVVR